MAQNEIGQFDEVDNNNTDISGTTIVQGQMYPYMVDNAFRNLAGMLKRWFKTSLFRLRDSTDQTKLVAFDLSGLPTATTRTWTAPYYSGTLGLVSDIRGYIFGLTMSNNATDATNDIDIAAGSAVDATGSVSMLLTTTLVKRLDAAWAVGSGNGWLDTGSIGNNTYHVFLIRRPDTGVVDSVASLSPSSPTLPANYTQFRRIGSIIRLGGTILGFFQSGNVFRLNAPITDVNATNPGTGPVIRTLTVPTGISVTANVVHSLFSNTVSQNYSGLLSSFGNATYSAPTTTIFDVVLLTLATAGGYKSSITRDVVTNNSAQIRSQMNVSDASLSQLIVTLGWTDARGA